jgi:hypothetical protein
MNRPRSAVHLDADQLTTLNHLNEQFGIPIAEMLRQAVDAWLKLPRQQALLKLSGGVYPL